MDARVVFVFGFLCEVFFNCSLHICILQLGWDLESHESMAQFRISEVNLESVRNITVEVGLIGLNPKSYAIVEAFL